MLAQPARQASARFTAAVRIDLDRDDARALAGLISAAAQSAGNRARSGASGGLLGTEAVARLIGYAPSTIRAWLARSLPRDNPFPQPERHLARNHWQLTQIKAWQARQASLTERRGKRK